MAAEYEADFTKQCSTYADEWDEWYGWVLSDRAEFQADVHAIKQFTDDLRNYLVAQSTQSPSQADSEASMEMMQSLALEMLACESDMIARMDEHISELREFVTCMTELEASDRHID